MDYLVLIVAVAVVVGVFWLARPPVVFVIKYRNGTPSVVRGRLTVAMLASIDEICRQNRVTSGTITAITYGKRVRMKFSADISPGCQQQIRNLMLVG